MAIFIDVNIRSYLVERVRKQTITIHGRMTTSKEMAETLKKIFFTEGEDAFLKDLVLAVENNIISNDNGCKLIDTLVNRKEVKLAPAGR